jgi:hypothetical protein
MHKSFENTGFTPPADRSLGSERRTTTLAELVTTIALALSTIVAATVITVGIARADVGQGVIDHDVGVFGVALLLGLIFIGMSGLTTLTLPFHWPKKH